MTFIPIRYDLTIASAYITLLISLVSNLPLVAEAQTFKLTKRQFLRHQVGIGLHCGSKSQLVFKEILNLQSESTSGDRVDSSRCPVYNSPILLTALIPDSNISLTLSEYPTLFFYIPHTQAAKAGFVLRDEQDNELYNITIPIKNNYGIVSVSIPSSTTLPPLKVGKYYWWSFALILNPSARDEDAVVSGVLKRVQLEPTVERKLNNASLRDRPAIYAANGIWHETLTSLVKLGCSNPQDSTIVTEWRSLLKQVRLPEIAKEPLAQCPSELNQ